MVRWNKAYIKGTKNIVGVDDKLSKDVEFICMACGTTMIRKLGATRVHHFAHYPKNEKCNPEGYFHKLGKIIFKEIYDESSNFIIKTSSKDINLKLEYGECFIEKREDGEILKRNSDLYIKHKRYENKDISVEIFFSHQVTKKKLDKGFRIIEIRLPISVSNQDNTESNEIEKIIRNICTPPLFECDNIRLYNFEEVNYQEVSSFPNIYNHTNNKEQDCIEINKGKRIIPNFKNYISSKDTKIKENNPPISKSKKYPQFVPSKDSRIQKHESSISGYLLQPHMRSIKSTIYFDVDDFIKLKYPNIRHQPAMLPNYNNIIDVILSDDNNEYWLGIDYKKNEVFEGDFERKIPNEWQEAMREYIKNLKPIKKLT